MANEEPETPQDPQSSDATAPQQQQQQPSPISDSDSDSDYSSDDEEEEDEDKVRDQPLTYTRPGDDIGDLSDSDDSPEANFKRFSMILDSRRMRRRQEEEQKNHVYYEDLFDFPEDKEKWREEDLKELWADPPLGAKKPGWDPAWADEEDWEIVRDEIKAGKDPVIAPFYVPYRKPYPAIPDNHYDISNPKAVVEELDRIEEFLKWVSFIFPDGSSYEGTVWDDLAHGKGVYIAEQGLVRYEGEWLQNNMEGHGVIEVDIPDIEPLPGSKLEAQMRAEGHVFSRDFMSPEDREWLEKDIEDSFRLADGNYEIPFYENDEWIKQFGKKPEKGRYRYAGQWKHGRMHGCGVYEVNERTIWGRFYFGELLDDTYGCDEDTSALHAGIAEVAAAKARMFVNKPDGMVREERGPYGDPQHPYFYEEDDVWMAPGFINQFYEVPDYWKTYVHEVDQEREMWLNSFYKAPLRIPMPAELEHWWSTYETIPEFVLINKEPEPDPKDPSKLIYTEDPLILHTPTGRLINYVEDEEHGIRLFWQPPLKEGEDVDPDKAEFLPLGFDEFYGRDTGEKEEGFLTRVVLAIENALKPGFERLEKWTEEKKKAGETKMKLIEKELDLIEAEICLEEAIEDMDEELKMREKEEEKEVEMGLQVEKDDTPAAAKQEEKASIEEEEEEAEEEDDEDDDDDVEPSSFGSVAPRDDSSKNGQNKGKPGQSPFSSCSLVFAPSSLLSAVSSLLQPSHLPKKPKTMLKDTTLASEVSDELPGIGNTVRYPLMPDNNRGLRAVRRESMKPQMRKASMGSTSQLGSLSKILLSHSHGVKHKKGLQESRISKHHWLQEATVGDLGGILSLHSPLYISQACMDNYTMR